MSNAVEPVLLLVENEEYWVEKIKLAVGECLSATWVVKRSFDEAFEYARTCPEQSFVAAFVDVRLRENLYDQSGLAILHELKKRWPDFPVTLLTAFAPDYPGLDRTIMRYKRVEAYSKDTFLEESVFAVSASVAFAAANRRPWACPRIRRWT
jgi:hypothetical protein